VLHTVEVPVPANDAFANATPITAIPFTDRQDTTAATLEAGEQPAPGCGFGLVNSIWYAYTPSQNGAVQAQATGTLFSASVQVYTGATLTSLTSVGCGAFNGPVTFGVTAGTTYHFQVGGISDRGVVAFSLTTAPPVVPDFFTNPSDPNTFDTVGFFDGSDTAGGTLQSSTWTFGDGATATGSGVEHRYAADGDYTIRHAISTTDGRTGSITKVLAIRTHDIGIASVSLPKSARARTTVRITVRIRDTRYPEAVQVQLLKSVPPGGGQDFQVVGTLIQSVPVQDGGRTTQFDFNYTFTDGDAVLGKITFEVFATIVGARDALITDNTVIEPAIPVRG
jgi:hypothetical protein